MAVSLQSIRGFRDLYPNDKAVQNYVFDKLKEIASLYGFENYDGPILEPIDLYLGKSSKELVEQQTFQVKDKNDQTMVMRPEMTPSLARMVAQKINELVFPLKLFNLGLRFRYEAPQKGRVREFYQADYDILGSSNVLADAEILATAVNIFKSLGGTEKNFVLYLNSRTYLEKKFVELEIDEKIRKQLLSLIDRKDKTNECEFLKSLEDIGLATNQIDQLNKFLTSDIKFEDDPYFSELFSILESYGISQYCKINLNVVRGLDYYTGIVFEVKGIGSMRRSLLGGGRYDNLVSSYGGNTQIPGVGFATSDVSLLEFMKDNNLIPENITTKSSKYLITVFNAESANYSVKIVEELRKNNIASEIYPDFNKKLDKQLKYADRNNMPFAIVAGPEEIKKNILKIKDMKSGEQKEIKFDDIRNLK